MQSIILKRVVILVAVIVGYLPLSKAEEGAVIVDSRYTTERVGATPGQTALLKNVFREHIPPHITTVGEAIEYVLRPFGYQLLVDELKTESQYVLLALPLPKPHRTLGPITLAEALSVLGGDSFTSVINPVTRRVSFQLKDSYRSYITDLDIEHAKVMWLDTQEKRSLLADLPDERSKQPVLPGYGPVAPGEYLSAIVKNFQVQGITHDQALVHIFTANPDAFSNDNMNYLLRGAMLTIPAFDDPSMLSAEEASHIVEDQYRIWKNQKVTP